LLIPTELSETFNTGWNSQDIPGRSAPYYSFTGNDARSVSFSITLHDDINEDLMETVDALRRACYPRYSGNIIEPPYFYIKFGEMVNMVGTMGGLSYTWEGSIISKNTLDDSRPLQHFSKVDISLDFNELRVRRLPTIDLNPFEEGR
jgi:hypothetical protein